MMAFYSYSPRLDWILSDDFISKWSECVEPYYPYTIGNYLKIMELFGIGVDARFSYLERALPDIMKKYYARRLYNATPYFTDEVLAQGCKFVAKELYTRQMLPTPLPIMFDPVTQKYQTITF